MRNGFLKNLFYLFVSIVVVSCGGGSSFDYEQAMPGTSVDFWGPSASVTLEGLNADESALIERALSMAGGMPTGTGDASIFEVKSFSGEGINDWLRPRVKSIFGADTRLRSVIIEPSDAPYSVGTDLDKPVFQKVLNHAYMANLSSIIDGDQDQMLRMTGKKFVHKLRTKNGVVDVTDHTGGAFLVGRAMTRDHMKNFAGAVGYKRDHYFNLAMTVSVLIHEARHGEGSGFFKGLSHRRCPHRKVPEDFPICDDTANGPNGTAVVYLKYANRLCHDCNRHERAAFEEAILEFQDRVIPGSPKRDLRVRAAALETNN